MGTLAATPEQLTLSCDDVGRQTGDLVVLTDPPTPNLSIACAIEEPYLATVNAPVTTDSNGEAAFKVTCTGCGTTTLEFRVPGNREWNVLKVHVTQKKTRSLPSETETEAGAPARR